jgi:hypothetical protein
LVLTDGDDNRPPTSCRRAIVPPPIVDPGIDAKSCATAGEGALEECLDVGVTGSSRPPTSKKETFGDAMGRGPRASSGATGADLWAFVPIYS